MNNEVLQHIEDSLQEVRALFMRAAIRIEAIKPGEKIPATTLAELLAKEQGMTGAQLYPICKLLVNDKYPGVVIRRGAHGGIVKLPVVGTKIVEQSAVDKPNADGENGGVPENGSETAASI
jgi:hypothetical protein